MPDTTDVYRYWAFISYSTKDDKVARKLLRRLESYHLPRDLVGRPGRDEPVPRRLLPIFRDRDELPLSSDLGASIEDALRASRYLIVLCSRNSVNSRWVNEEIRYFKSLGREDRILAIMLDGEPNASDHPETVEQECFPLALRYRVDDSGQLTDQRTEPIAGDLRKGGDGWRGSYLKAVAGITGLGFDALAQREQRRRRRRQLASSFIATVVAVSLLLVGYWQWDYNRVKVADFANVSERWGVPEGVGRLDTATRDGRWVHYRIESQRNNIRKVLRFNGAGKLRADPDNHGAAIEDILYGEDGSIQQIDLRDHNGQLVLRQSFTALTDGQVHYIDFTLEHQGAPLALSASTGVLGIGTAQDQTRRSDITAHGVL